MKLLWPPGQPPSCGRVSNKNVGFACRSKAYANVAVAAARHLGVGVLARVAEHALAVAAAAARGVKGDRYLVVE